MLKVGYQNDFLTILKDEAKDLQLKLTKKLKMINNFINTTLSNRKLTKSPNKPVLDKTRIPKIWKSKT